MSRLLALLLLAACTDVNYGAAFNFGSGGVDISPSVSGSLGDAYVTISN
jgi:hypothetical protein